MVSRLHVWRQLLEPDRLGLILPPPSPTEGGGGEAVEEVVGREVPGEGGGLS